MEFVPIFDDIESFDSMIAAPASLAMNESESRFDNDDDFIEVFVGFSPLLLKIASFTCILLMLIGIPGNLITIIALARCKKIRNATTIFIMNLSFSDLLFCCFNLPLAASMYYHKGWIHGQFMCQLFPLFRYGLLAVSLVSILTITINRYVMISHPRIYPKIFKNRNLIIIIVLTWMFGFGSLYQTWHGNWGAFGLDRNASSCSIKAKDGKSPKEFLFLMAFVLPCSAIVVCYARIFYIVRRAERKASEPIKGTENEMKLEIDVMEDGESSQRINLNSKKRLADLRYIDTSVESDSPPTMLSLRESVNNNAVETCENNNVNEDIKLELDPSSSSSGVDVSFDKISHSDCGKKQRKYRKRAETVSSLTEKLSKRDKKLLKMILVIFLTFLTCYLPITLIKLTKLSGIKIISIIGHLLIYLTTCINPIIYVVMSSEYRQAYKNLLTCSSTFSNSDDMKRHS